MEVRAIFKNFLFPRQLWEELGLSKVEPRVFLTIHTAV